MNEFSSVSVLLFLTAMATPSISSADILNTNGDTKIIKSQPNENFGRNGWLHVDGNSRVLLSFASHGFDGDPLDVELRVTIIPNGVRAPGSIAVYAIAGPWSEQTVTWANQPPLGPKVAQTNIESSDSGTEIAFDVTEIVNDWITGNTPNFGFLLAPDAPGTKVVFRSRESRGGAFKPRLDFSLIVPSTNVVTVSPTTPADYSSPVDAADNADRGAKWCDRTLPIPCAIKVKAGTYIVGDTIVLNGIELRGDGRGATKILAARDVEAVVRGEGTTSPSWVSDMTIVNRKPENIATGLEGFVFAERLAIIVDAPGGASGIRGNVFGQDIQEPLIYRDVSITGVSGFGTPFGSASGISGKYLDLSNVTIDVRGGRQARGVGGSTESQDLVFPAIRITNSEIRVIGKNRDSWGVLAGNLELNGVDIITQGDFEVMAVAAGNRRPSQTAINDSRLVARGLAPTADVVGVYVTAAGLATDSWLTINNSQISAESSMFGGGSHFSITGDGSDLSVGNSMLSGQVSITGGSTKCVHSHDGDFTILNEVCQASQ